ncbi:hypothetical protein ELG77_35570 [Rhizobium leguminosarum]|nr:hypothetical protein ELG92_36435 [Rhizobium leguminosarum]TBG28585.1 hypothetical protein ELG77_35570 [Rhizobium leguminosarum]TBG72955.1 hypothetical protein ELG69_32620 [Rhizobium leguminosarum]TBG94110.1 hypothetical protein ELG68_37935 [Rhizobium leguminosarum]
MSLECSCHAILLCYISQYKLLYTQTTSSAMGCPLKDRAHENLLFNSVVAACCILPPYLTSRRSPGFIGSVPDH